MADEKVTQLTENTSLVSTDLLYLVDDPSGTPLGQKVSVATLVNGWIAAAETWTYYGETPPLFTVTISGDKTGIYWAGMKVKLTQTTTKYFIIVKSEYSNPNTILTLYGGTLNTLLDAAISSPYYSLARFPQEFPLVTTYWEQIYKDTSDRTQASPVQNTWYNLGSASLSLPIGFWVVSYKVNIQCDDAASPANITVALSSSPSSSSDTEWEHRGGNSIQGNVNYPAFNSKYIFNTGTFTYYLIVRTTNASMDTLHFRGDATPTIIRAFSAYI